MKQTTVSSFTQIATNDFTARVYPSRNRVPYGALERLERYAGKLARIVLRGLGGGNASRLLGGGLVLLSNQDLAFYLTSGCATTMLRRRGRGIETVFIPRNREEHVICATPKLSSVCFKIEGHEG
jgi:hypothetical protein